MIYSIRVSLNSVTIAPIIFPLTLVGPYETPFFFPVTLTLIMNELAPVAVTNRLLFLTDSMQFILIPFSNIFIPISVCHYSHTLPLSLCIKVSSVPLPWIIFFTIFEPILDSLEFRLKQPLKLLSIGYEKDSIWKHLQAIVNLHSFLAFHLHDLFKALMSCSRCLIITSESKGCLEWIMSFLKNIQKLEIVFLQQISHLPGARMQEVMYQVGIINGISEDIYD